MRELAKILLWPDGIGNGLHGFTWLYLRILLCFLALDLLLYGPCWLGLTACPVQ